MIVQVASVSHFLDVTTVGWDADLYELIVLGLGSKYLGCIITGP